METCNFGEHYMLDGYGGDYARLNDGELVLRALSDLPKELGMKKLIEPVILEAPDNDIKDPGGFSGFVVIAESHISIHTFPARKFVSIDVYTCRNGLDVKFVGEYFKNLFGLTELEENFVKRGTRYPCQNLA